MTEVAAGEAEAAHLLQRHRVRLVTQEERFARIGDVEGRDALVDVGAHREQHVGSGVEGNLPRGKRQRGQELAGLGILRGAAVGHEHDGHATANAQTRSGRRLRRGCARDEEAVAVGCARALVAAATDASWRWDRGRRWQRGAADDVVAQFDLDDALVMPEVRDGAAGADLGDGAAERGQQALAHRLRHADELARRLASLPAPSTALTRT